MRDSRLITDNGGVLRAKQLLAICAEVLGQKTSKLRTPEQLQRIFSATRFLRRLDRMGYAQFLARGHCSLLTRYRALQRGGRRPDDAKRRKKVNAAATTTAGRPASSSGVIRARLVHMTMQEENVSPASVDELSRNRDLLQKCWSCRKLVFYTSNAHE